MDSLTDFEGAKAAAPTMSEKLGSEDVSVTSGNDRPAPTEEELATLPKASGKIPWTAFTVGLVVFAERFSHYGTTAVCKCYRFLQAVYMLTAKCRCKLYPALTSSNISHWSDRPIGCASSDTGRFGNGPTGLDWLDYMSVLHVYGDSQRERCLLIQPIANNF
jgi:hypothetical protein